MPKFKLLKRNENCVLLEYKRERGRYMVRDIENDILYTGWSYEKAEKMFDSYDINEVRKQRAEQLERWMEEFVEAL